MAGFGRLFILLGLLLVLLGVMLSFADKIPHIGRLPGDILVRKERFQFYFPITTCIIVSIILTLFLSLFRR